MDNYLYIIRGKKQQLKMIQQKMSVLCKLTVFYRKNYRPFVYRYCVLLVHTKELLGKQKKHQVLCVYVKEDFMDTCVNMKVNVAHIPPTATAIIILPLLSPLLFNK